MVFRRDRRLGLSNVFPSFAGYRDPTYSVHQAIAAFKLGDRLQVRMDTDRWDLLDDNGMVVGKLARGFSARLARPKPTPMFWLSSPGIGNVPSPSTGRACAATLGKLWCRSWCLHRRLDAIRRY